MARLSGSGAMDAAFTSRPADLEPFPCGGAGAATMHSNPFSFGLAIALPQPASSGPFYGAGGDPVHAPYTNPFGIGFDPFSGGGAVPALHANPFGFGFGGLGHPPLTTGFHPFSGGATVHADEHSGGVAVPKLHANAFGFGFGGLAHPPLTTGFHPFSGGATVHADEHSNPFTVDPWDDPPPPARFDPFATGADSPRTPVYGNPYDADGGAALATDDVPAPWEWSLYNGHFQPAVHEAVPPRLIPAPSVPICEPYDDSDDDNIETILRAQEEDGNARPSPDYLDTTLGGRMNPGKRAALVRWMSQLTQRYDLAPGMLHRAVSYADRFLSARPLVDAGASEHQLNLLGAAAVYAAAKYEDQGTALKLDAGEIARYGGFAAGRDVVAMERALLAALGYRLGGPTAHTFVEHFTRGCGGSREEEDDDDELRCRAHDLAKVSLLHYGCLELKPSAVAAAAVFLAGMMTVEPSFENTKSWDRKIKELTGYDPKDLEHGVDAIRSLIPEDDGNGFDLEIFPLFFPDPE